MSLRSKLMVPMLVASALTCSSATLAMAESSIDAQTAVNAANYTTTSSGVKYASVLIGQGDPAAKGDSVSIRYNAWLPNGTLVDMARDHGDLVSVKVGEGKVVKGLEEALVGMRAGEVRQVMVPPGLAYGAKGNGRLIPGNTVLTYKVEMVSIAH